MLWLKAIWNFIKYIIKAALISFVIIALFCTAAIGLWALLAGAVHLVKTWLGPANCSAINLWMDRNLLRIVIGLFIGGLVSCAAWWIKEEKHRLETKSQKSEDGGNGSERKV